MKVLGVGFGRTGTVSLKAALEELGFGPCYHMQTVLDQPERARHWTAAARGRPNWDTVFAGFASTVEWPAAAFWKELVDHYPDAKVILSVRDPERWSASAQRTILRERTRSDRWAAAIRRRVQPEVLPVHRMIGEVVVRGVFGSRTAHRADLADTFRRHNEAVVRHVESRRLLVYDVSHGWPPLCAFLGVPVPAVPFPHANDRRTFRRKEWEGLARAAARDRRIVARLAIAAPVAVAAGRVIRGRRGRTGQRGASRP